MSDRTLIRLDDVRDIPDPEPVEAPWLIDVADLLAQGDPGPTPWLIDGLIVDQALVAVVGRWKTTKSYGLLDLCIAIATGRPAFGKLPIANPGPVIFINEESGLRALWRRADALCRGRAIDPEELRGQLHAAANAHVKLDDAGWQNDLLDVGKELRPRLMVFDPLARMKAAERDENEQKGMAKLIEFMRYLRDEVSCAVAFVHHTGHNGEHMRGSSDLESAWETRLSWKRDGQSPEIKVESEHREADALDPITYRIAWDVETRTMRFELEEDPLENAVRRYLANHPDASANEVNDNIDGKRRTILALVKTIRDEVVPTGSQTREPPYAEDIKGGSPQREPPGNHPPKAPTSGGSPAPLFRGAGTTNEVPGSQNGRPPPDFELPPLDETLAPDLDDEPGYGE